MTAGEFVDAKGNVLNSFREAAEYHERSGEDVYVWWETLHSEPPAQGWKKEKDKYCAVEGCWEGEKGHFVSCIKCPRAYHLSCITSYSVSVDVATFECELLDRSECPTGKCTTRIEPLLKRS